MTHQHGAAPSPPHAGVRFPPPLLYVAGIGAGLALHRAWPLRMTAGASIARSVTAAICLVGYVVIFVGAFAGFRRARTTLIPNRPAAALVTTGPYRFTRNPMYVSLVLLYGAVTLFVNSWWPVVLLPLVLVAADRLVIAPEERYLAAAFPAEYRAYRSRVRRWL
jgi:protein-S-isoprenylcysteine O-methyltransferase Ste14